MNTLLLFVVLLCAIMISGSFASPGSAANAGQRDRAVMRFDQPVQVLGVVLKGQYLFVHDDAAMARGEACTFIYKGDSEIPSKLVVSFHCTPVQRVKANHFTTRTAEISPGLVELREFQFDGDTEAHMVPASH